MEEMSPGSEAWLTWRDILNLFDIICCCLVLFQLYGKFEFKNCMLLMVKREI